MAPCDRWRDKQANKHRIETGIEVRTRWGETEGKNEKRHELVKRNQQSHIDADSSIMYYVWRKSHRRGIHEYECEHLMTHHSHTTKIMYTSK